MNYATWKLNFTDPDYGTGPEETIQSLGFFAEGAWVEGAIEDGGTVLGYVSAPQDEQELANWDFTNITHEEALDFAQFLNEEAYLSEDGRILAPVRNIL
jgi:hypothetical protein